MATQLATRENNGVVQTAPSFAQRMGYTTEQVDLIKRTVAKNATDVELEFFLASAKRLNLDPIAKQIYFIKRGGDASIQTGIDGYRAIAQRTGEYDGQDAPVYGYDDKGKLDSATVTVWRKGMGRGISATAYYTEYAQVGNMWSKMPRTMLAKCAESLALRKAFPQDFSGVYSASEMEQARSEQKLLDNPDAPLAQEPVPDAPPRVTEPVLPVPEMAEIVKVFQARYGDASLRDWLVANVAPDLLSRKKVALFPDEARRAYSLLTAVDEAPVIEEAQIVEPPSAPDLVPETKATQRTIFDNPEPIGIDALREVLMWTPEELANFLEAMTEESHLDETTGEPIVTKKGVRVAGKLSGTQRLKIIAAMRAEISPDEDTGRLL